MPMMVFLKNLSLNVRQLFSSAMVHGPGGHAAEALMACLLGARQLYIRVG